VDSHLERSARVSSGFFSMWTATVSLDLIVLAYWSACNVSWGSASRSRARSCRRTGGGSGSKAHQPEALRSCSMCRGCAGPARESGDARARGRRRAGDPPGPADEPRGARLRGRDGGDRRGCGCPRRRGRSRSRVPGPWPPRHRRDRGDPADPGLLGRARRRAHGAGSSGRQGGGAGRRCRRLRHQSPSVWRRCSRVPAPP